MFVWLSKSENVFTAEAKKEAKLPNHVACDKLLKFSQVIGHLVH